MACALNDLEVLKRCIPGCERLEKESDTEMTAMVVLRVGPVKATFEGVFRRGDMLDKIGHFPDQSAKPFCDHEVIVRHDNARSQCMLPTGILTVAIAPLPFDDCTARLPSSILTRSCMFNNPMPEKPLDSPASNPRPSSAMLITA